MGETWIGVDPGARETGLAVVAGPDVPGMERLLHHEVIAREPDQSVREYALTVLRQLDRARWAHAAIVADPPLVGAAEENGLGEAVLPPVAVEGVLPPNPHLGMVAVGCQQDTAVVLGAVLGYDRDAVVVRPGRHGRQLLVSYPPVLRGPRERGPYGSTSNPLRHCRSALDVARQGPRTRRLQQALGASA
jgi:hypothetical protein